MGIAQYTQSAHKSDPIVRGIISMMVDGGFSWIFQHFPCLTSGYSLKYLGAPATFPGPSSGDRRIDGTGRRVMDSPQMGLTRSLRT